MSSFPNDTLLDWRGIPTYWSPKEGDFRPVCSACNGSGTKLYGSTATWHGGIGGAAMTTDVCDKCWGSGNSERPWPSHRLFYQMQRELEAFKKKEEKSLEPFAKVAQAKINYIEYTSNHPSIHCNRFPSWEELSDVARSFWIEKSKEV